MATPIGVQTLLPENLYRSLLPKRHSAPAGVHHGIADRSNSALSIPKGHADEGINVISRASYADINAPIKLNVFAEPRQRRLHTRPRSERCCSDKRTSSCHNPPSCPYRPPAQEPRRPLPLPTPSQSPDFSFSFSLKRSQDLGQYTRIHVSESPSSRLRQAARSMHTPTQSAWQPNHCC